MKNSNTPTTPPPNRQQGTLGLLPEACVAGPSGAVEAEKVLHALGALHEHCPAAHLPPKVRNATGGSGGGE